MNSGPQNNAATSESAQQPATAVVSIDIETLLVRQRVGSPANNMQWAWYRIIDGVINDFKKQVLQCAACKRVHWESLSEKSRDNLRQFFHDMRSSKPAEVTALLAKDFEDRLGEFKVAVDEKEKEDREANKRSCDASPEAARIREDMGETMNYFFIDFRDE